MKTTMTNLTLITAAVMTALIAGLFYAWSCSIVQGLGKLDNAGYLSAMQSINREILNPVFFSCFMGAVIMLPVTTLLHYGTNRFWLLLAAAIVYIIGVFGVTAAGNVPLNNMIDAINLHTATLEDLARCRKLFENTWNNLNLVRTVAAIASLVLVLLACLKGK